MRKQLPPRDMPWFDEQGRPTDIFYDYVKDLERRSLGQPVSVTAAANNQVLVYESASGLFVPRNTLTKPVSSTEPANGEVLIYNSGTGLYTPGAN